MKGQMESEWQGWKNTPIFGQGEYKPAPTVVYDLMAKGPVCVATLLFPTPIGEKCPVEKIELTGNLDDLKVRIDLLNGQSVVI